MKKLEDILTDVTGLSATNILETLKKEFSKNEILEFSVEDFLCVKGIGSKKANEIYNIIQFANQFASNVNDVIIPKQIDSPSQFLPFIWEKITDINKEHLIVISLNCRGRFINADLISIGTAYASLLGPPEVFYTLLKRHALQFILAHNHPSNEYDPSDMDIQVTKRLKECGKIMGIELVDHIIVTENDYFSFKENSLVL